MRRNSLIGPVFLISAGAVILIRNLFPETRHVLGLAPVILIAAGVCMLIERKNLPTIQK